MTTPDAGLRFVPSRVVGLPLVAEVVVYADRLDLLSAGRWVSIPWASIADWPRPASFWRWLGRHGWRTKRVPVGERDWLHPPSDRFFRFSTRPPLTIYLPEEPSGLGYGLTLFYRIEAMLRQGGFATWDLG